MFDNRKLDPAQQLDHSHSNSEISSTLSAPNRKHFQSFLKIVLDSTTRPQRTTGFDSGPFIRLALGDAAATEVSSVSYLFQSHIFSLFLEEIAPVLRVRAGVSVTNWLYPISVRS